jgi:hypothetical protein
MSDGDIRRFFSVHTPQGERQFERALFSYSIENGVLKVSQRGGDIPLVVYGTAGWLRVEEGGEVVEPAIGGGEVVEPAIGGGEHLHQQGIQE